MNNLSRVIILLACSVTLLAAVLLVTRPAEPVTLQQLASNCNVRPVALGPSSFDESAEMLFQDIRRSLLADEDNRTLVKLASELEWRLVGPIPEGIRSFTTSGGTIQTAVESFANRWEVVGVIEKDTLVFASKTQ